jgi:hypothetical protein
MLILAQVQLNAFHAAIVPGTVFIMFGAPTSKIATIRSFRGFSNLHLT